MRDKLRENIFYPKELLNCYSQNLTFGTIGSSKELPGKDLNFKKRKECEIMSKPLYMNCYMYDQTTRTPNPVRLIWQMLSHYLLLNYLINFLFKVGMKTCFVILSKWIMFWRLHWAFLIHQSLCENLVESPVYQKERQRRRREEERREEESYLSGDEEEVWSRTRV